MAPLRLTELSGFSQIGSPILTTRLIDKDQTDLDLFVLFGSPTDVQVFTVIIANTVVVGSSSTPIPALTTTASFAVGSTFIIVLQGSGQVAGAGGAGGVGGSFPLAQLAGGYAGGGGGGAGPNVAVGGGVQDLAFAFNGQVGGVVNLGSGGGGAEIEPIPSPPPSIVASGVGSVGGTGIETFYDMTIDGVAGPGDGRVFGGGGGGAGGNETPQLSLDLDGGNGGGYGLPGSANSLGFGGALAGFAIVENGKTITYLPNKGALDIRGSAPA